MTRVAIVAALPGELKPLVKGWHFERRNGVDLWRTQRPGSEWIAACAGMGQAFATRAFAEIEKGGRVDLAISAGWVGALQPGIEAGEAFLASGVIDLRTGERFPCFAPNEDCILLVTASTVAGAEEKARLASEYGAALVDMEAAAIARLARMRGIPFACVKGVSDGADDRLLDFNRFIGADGKLRLARLLIFVLPRPWLWPALVRMGENSSQASRSMRKLLLEKADSLEAIANRNGDSNFAS